MKRLTRSLMERSLRVQEGLAEIGSKVQESLTGIHVIKAYCVEDHDAQAFRELNDRFNEQGLALARLRGAMVPMVRSSSAVAVMIVLIYGGALVVAHTMSLGQLIAFMSYLGLLAWPTTSLGWMLSIYQRGKAAMRRLNEIYENSAAAQCRRWTASWRLPATWNGKTFPSAIFPGWDLAQRPALRAARHQCKNSGR